MGSMHVKSPDRRDRLWLINAFAVVLLTLLGAALGYDRMLKTNTSSAACIRCSATGLHALRPDPQHARSQAASAHETLRPDAARPTAVRQRFRASLINESDK
jgi:hypothetical protein